MALNVPDLGADWMQDLFLNPTATSRYRLV